MRGVIKLVVLVCSLTGTMGLICFNCSASQAKISACSGDFAPPYLPFNATKSLLANCSGENAMCFVRSWRARSKHAWIVQRGCYKSSQDDPIPRLMSKPTRAMSCTKRRLPEAEYKVCLCQSNWCNSGFLNSVSMYQLVHVIPLLNIMNTYLCRIYIL